MDPPASSDASRRDRVIQRLDEVQQQRPWLAVPLAVWRKFSEDEAGKMASLISYYAFISIFPLLIVFATILSRVLVNYPDLADQIVRSAAGSFLSIGSTGDVTPLPSRIGQIRCYGAAALPDVLQCRVAVLSQADDALIRCHITLFDEQQRLRVEIQGFECTADRELNRLGGGWAGGLRCAGS